MSNTNIIYFLALFLIFKTTLSIKFTFSLDPYGKRCFSELLSTSHFTQHKQLLFTSELNQTTKISRSVSTIMTEHHWLSINDLSR